MAARGRTAMLRVAAMTVVAAMMMVVMPAAVVVPGTAATMTGVSVGGKAHHRQNGDQYSTNSLRHLYVPLKLRTA